MAKISLIAGARPNFMKIAPLVRAFTEHGLETRIIHTGQHYDRQMSQTFFDELNIPEPDVNLGVGSGSHVWQLAEVMRKLEEDFVACEPNMVVVVGDVNSTVAGAVTANKLGIPVAHVEAGLRSFDRGMPEEINRLITDAIADWLFTSEPAAAENLRAEGVAEERIHFVGNVMIDTLLTHLPRARELRQCQQYNLEAGKYGVLTLHRPSNVDDRERLTGILTAVSEINAQLPIVAPVHPRTRSRMKEFGLDQQPEVASFLRVEPLGYHAMLSLIDSAAVVLTDSGGLQEETTVVGVPCLTLRENTERPITISEGTNVLVGCQQSDITAAFETAVATDNGEPPRPPLWDGQASQRIAQHVLKITA